MPNQFFTEGDDIKFIKDILSFKNKSKQNDIFIKTNGWTNLHLIASKFLENTNKRGRNLVFFDADGDAEQRRTQLLKTSKELGITFELFLFPNNTDSGIVENLFLEIILPKFHSIFNCFDNYSQCISDADENYFLPNLKSKFFSFTESTGQKTHLKDINFANSNFYDLNHKSLDQLFEFIEHNV